MIGNLLDEKIDTRVIDKVVKIYEKESSRVARFKNSNRPYANLEDAKSVLYTGFEAIKYNYSNKGIKKIWLRLSKDDKTLYWRELKQADSFGKQVWRQIKPESSIKLSKVKDLMYGALSFTFQKHKAYVLNAMRFEKELVGPSKHLRTRLSYNRMRLGFAS